MSEVELVDGTAVRLRQAQDRIEELNAEAANHRAAATAYELELADLSEDRESLKAQIITLTSDANRWCLRVKLLEQRLADIRSISEGRPIGSG